MLDLIVDHVYIGDAISVIGTAQRKQLEELKIQRVLTVSALSIDGSKQMSDIHYKFLFMMDTENQDILGDNLLEEAVGYIEKAVEDGANIVVHCEAGISRSVAVVAAYLMRRFEWSPKKALLKIKDKRHNAQPNPGFMRQLQIFEQLSYNACPRSLAASPIYRNFCADTGNLPRLHSRPSVDDSASTSVNDPNELGPNNAPKASLDQKSPEALAAQFKFRCRKCRTTLFYDTHVLYHSRGQSGTAGQPDDIEEEEEHSERSSPTAERTKEHSRIRKAMSLADRCEFEFFITPMNWMDVEQFQGKINCPKCSDKLGQYNWGGHKCIGYEDGRCGTYVSPWFHIQKAKVDKTRLQSQTALPPNCAIPTVVFS